ncbi:MAG: hypothetical protein ATN35_00090 [Epulopiscium sp. Nele67-Bin004]|nr:MAG: hypothetical protein ATN35_00090 [Epulopiscium sp. Nele67-Bin004]
MSDMRMDNYLNPKTVPVVVIENDETIERIGDICSRLLPTIEIPLRNEFALEAIKKMKRQYPNVAIGAATIRTEKQADAAIEAGADVVISPASPLWLLEYCSKNNLPYMPGVSSPTDVENAVTAGFKVLKFFPAALNGGTAWLNALNSVYKNFGVEWMPMGGITLDTLKGYFAVSNVRACGGSWMCPKSDIDDKNWEKIEQLFIKNNKTLEVL